jgi:hypothetical protein
MKNFLVFQKMLLKIRNLDLSENGLNGSVVNATDCYPKGAGFDSRVMHVFYNIPTSTSDFFSQHAATANKMRISKKKIKWNHYLTFFYKKGHK